MLKKTILLSFMYLFTINSSWAIDYENLKSNYDNLDEDLKYSYKGELKKFGWLETSVTNEFRAYINYDYVTPKTYELTEAWVKRVVYNDVSKDGLALNDYVMELKSYNCNTKSIRAISYTDYNSKTGKVLRSSSSPSYGSYDQFKAVIPGSVGEVELEAICVFSHIKGR